MNNITIHKDVQQVTARYVLNQFKSLNASVVDTQDAIYNVADAISQLFGGEPDPRLLEAANIMRRVTYLVTEYRKDLDRAVADRFNCDCITSGNAAKPKQHGADPHAKNCRVYTGR